MPEEVQGYLYILQLVKAHPSFLSGLQGQREGGRLGVRKKTKNTERTSDVVPPDGPGLEMNEGVPWNSGTPHSKHS